MPSRVTWPHPGEILKEEFLDPMGLTQYKLAQALHVQQTRIGEIVAGTRAITAETGLLLSAFFGTSEAFWMNLQVDYDRRVAKHKIADKLKQVKPHEEPCAIA
jgi:antitoxin HigA-1